MLSREVRSFKLRFKCHQSVFVNMFTFSVPLPSCTITARPLPLPSNEGCGLIFEDQFANTRKHWIQIG
jgi:hypothetical protein